MKEKLVIPMYMLHRINSINEIKYDENSAELFRRDYDLEERLRIFEALEWANEHPNYDFKSINKIFEDLHFPNSEIFTYLKNYMSLCGIITFKILR